jgi:molybdate transport system ATP-binding protein
MIEFNLQKKIGTINIDVKLACKKREALSITGESGAGKTTLLRLAAGLEKPDSGFIRINGQTLFCSREKINTPPHKRKISYVFQDYTLFPHWSIEKNILYTALDKDLGNYLIDHFNISHLRKRKPLKASGGERQRAALAQAVARKPDLLLLDEPFSSLDSKNRKIASEYLYSVRDIISCPVVLVTHDHEEALYIGDSFCEIEKGGIKGGSVISKRSFSYAFS